MKRSFILKITGLAAWMLIMVPRIMGQTGTDEQLAIMFFQDKDYEKAASLFDKLYEKKPSSYYYTYLIYSYLEMADYDQAEKLVRKQMKLEPQIMRYKVDLGYIYNRRGQPEKASKQYESIIRDLPADKNAVIEVANTFLSRRENDYAMRTYDKGRKLLNGTYPFNLEMAFLYQSAGDIPNMVEEYLNYVDFDPTKMKTVQDRLQDVLNYDPDGTRSEEIRKALLRRVQKNPELTYYSEMIIWFSVQQHDFDLALTQAKSLDRRQNQDGKLIFDLAKIFVNNDALDVAEEAFKAVLAKGKENPYATESRIQLLNVAYLKLTRDYQYTPQQMLELEKEFQTAMDELGKNVGTINLIRNFAHLEGFYFPKTDNAISLLNEAIAIPGITAQQSGECKLELADILLFKGDIWEATLLYSQVDKAFKNEPLGHTAKFKNAKLSYYIGEFDWAKAQADVLKAATSKLIANDAMDISLLIDENINLDSTGAALRLYAHADLLEFQNHDKEALQTLDSIALVQNEHALFDEVLYKKAMINLKKGNFPEADSLFARVYKTYPGEILADNALFKLAEMNERLTDNKPRAMELYQEILTKYPGSLFTVEARKRFRSLRGDPLN